MTKTPPAGAIESNISPPPAKPVWWLISERKNEGNTKRVKARTAHQAWQAANLLSVAEGVPVPFAEVCAKLHKESDDT